MLDLLIKNASVVDGANHPPFSSDIAIIGDKVSAVESLPRAEAKLVVDAAGVTVAPGFIGIHSHADLSLPLENHEKLLQPLIIQGITTFVRWE